MLAKSMLGASQLVFAVSCASSPSSTVKSAPALATGGSSCSSTVTVTVSMEVFSPSLTCNSNCNSVSIATSGLSKVGVALSPPVSVTSGPAVCTQVYVRPWPSGSVPEPLRLTTSPSGTD